MQKNAKRYALERETCTSNYRCKQLYLFIVGPVKCWGVKHFYCIIQATLQCATFLFAVYA